MTDDPEFSGLERTVATRQRAMAATRLGRTPVHMSRVVANLLARRGYARQQAASAYAQAWAQAAGRPLQDHSRAGVVRSGVLEVMVRNSTAIQELTFRKRQLLDTLGTLLPAEQIRDLRFRVGPVD